MKIIINMIIQIYLRYVDRLLLSQLNIYIYYILVLKINLKWLVADILLMALGTHGKIS